MEEETKKKEGRERKRKTMLLSETLIHCKKPKTWREETRKPWKREINKKKNEKKRKSKKGRLHE